MKTVPFIIAAILFLVTVAVCYFIWYALRGRFVRAKRALAKNDAKVEDAKDDSPKRKIRWGVPVDAYCYPKINDVMGYEFLTVVKVPEHLRPDMERKGKSSQPEEKTWEETSSEGFTTVETSKVTTTSGEGPSKEKSEETSFPSSAPKGPHPAREEPETEEEGINPQDINDLENIQDWTNKDVDNLPPDDALLAMLDAQPELVENREIDSDEARRLIEEKECLENYEKLQENYLNITSNTEDDSFGSDLMSELNNELVNMEPEPDDGPVEQDDLPDTE